jgi:hypothetical protein
LSAILASEPGGRWRAPARSKGLSMRPATRSIAIVAVFVAGACSAAVPAGSGPPATAAPALSTAVAAAELVAEVHSSPSCSCCHEWIAYLDTAGTTTSTVSETDIAAYKRALEIPEELWSCHTALIGGYVVEGHVPFEAIERLLAERPSVDGIALAGMPAGSPGMPGPKAAPLEVMAFGPAGVSLFGEF